MASAMRSQFDIDDAVIIELEREAPRLGCTTSDLAEIALRQMLRSQRKPSALPPLPTFQSGGTLVDITDHDAIE
jgi:hypothetical protein